MIHMDDGLDLRQRTQCIGQVGDAAAPVQILQCVDAGIQHDTLPQCFHFGYDIGSALTLIPQTNGVLHQHPLTAGGVAAVHYKGFVIAHVLFDKHGTLPGSAESRGQGKINDLIALCFGLLKQSGQHSRRRLRGLGKALKGQQFFIKLVFGQVDVLLIFLSAKQHLQRDAANIFLFQLGRRKVCSRVGDDANHEILQYYMVKISPDTFL